MDNALPPIPAKRYFTIGEVSELCGVKPYVLRYWEQEFTQLKPMKRRGNRRYYQHHEVLLVRRIRELLYDQGFTISGARNQLGDTGRGGPAHRDTAEDEALGFGPGLADELDGGGPLPAGLAAEAAGLGITVAGGPGGAAVTSGPVSALLPLAPAQIRAELMSIRALLSN